ncbi:MAG: L-aspartate oxidase [Planctomycetes bacterium]|nr:L-aspartate oxidase [Planctomycetota bacterium]
MTNMFGTDPTLLPLRSTDVLVMGTGAAGMMAASRLPRSLRVLMLSGGEVLDGSTRRAQGGVACALGKDDSPALHLEDTLYAGAGLCDESRARILVEEGPELILELLGHVAFDRNKEGELSLGREGAHSRNRILHAGGDATGKAIQEGLNRIVRSSENITLMKETRALELLTDSGRVVGALVRSRSGELLRIHARATVVATGGYCHLFQESTNPSSSTGDGIAMCLRAGARVRDMEFVQFHPTVLYVAGAPRFLISEAVRGEGGILRTAEGAAFMKNAHPLADLAPRDVVSRAILDMMISQRESCAFLDLTHLAAEEIRRRFPTIFSTCNKFGIDMTRQWIPVRPAAHYTMGGVESDEYGRAGLSGLYVCGEAANTGVHGANRLASNSLLEGLVFGRRVASTLSDELLPLSERFDPQFAAEDYETVHEFMPNDLTVTLKSIMMKSAGIYRHAESLEKTLRRLRNWHRLRVCPPQLCDDFITFRNLNLLGLALCHAALLRKESRGSHFRKDYPERDDKNFGRSFSLGFGELG